MSCTGAAELHIVTLRLMWQDPTGDGSFDTEGQLRGLDTLSGPGMHVVSASCLTGNWKERALGSETGVGAELPVDVQSQVIHVVC